MQSEAPQKQDNPVATHPCKYCGVIFSSRNKMFKHVRELGTPCFIKVNPSLHRYGVDRSFMRPPKMDFCPATLCKRSNGSPLSFLSSVPSTLECRFPCAPFLGWYSVDRNLTITLSLTPPLMLPLTDTVFLCCSVDTLLRPFSLPNKCQLVYCYDASFPPTPSNVL